MKYKFRVFILVVVAIISVTLLACEKANAQGIIKVTGKFYYSDSVSIDIYVLGENDSGTERINRLEWGDYGDYNIRLEGGYNYRIVFNNGKITKHLQLINLVPYRKWYQFRKQLKINLDVLFDNNKSAKVEQKGNFFKFNTNL